MFTNADGSIRAAATDVDAVPVDGLFSGRRCEPLRVIRTTISLRVNRVSSQWRLLPKGSLSQTSQGTAGLRNRSATEGERTSTAPASPPASRGRVEDQRQADGHRLAVGPLLDEGRLKCFLGLGRRDRVYRDFGTASSAASRSAPRQSFVHVEGHTRERQSAELTCPQIVSSAHPSHFATVGIPACRRSVRIGPRTRLGLSFL